MNELELITQDELPVGYTIDHHGCVHNEFGQYVKSFTLPPAIRKRAEAAHKKFRKNTDLKRMLDDEFGPRCVSIIDKLSEIIFYDQAAAGHRWAEWKSAEKLKALELVMAYRNGRPHTHKKIDQTVDVKYDAKISVINRLIEQNKDKIQLIVDNTKDEEIDAEFEEVVDEVTDLG